jgi:hypothetical protein
MMEILELPKYVSELTYHCARPIKYMVQGLSFKVENITFSCPTLKHK